MTTLIPNSNGHADTDRFIEYNTCHSPGDGKFCSGGGAPDAHGFSQGKPTNVRRDHAAAVKQHNDALDLKHGPSYMTSHRGVEIHALPGYTTPYYYAKHQALGSFHHSMSLRRVKNQINDVIDRGMTPRKKASARYQRRKRTYGS